MPADYSLGKLLSTQSSSALQLVEDKDKLLCAPTTGLQKWSFYSQASTAIFWTVVALDQLWKDRDT